MGTKLRHSFEGCGSLGGFAATGELIIPNGTILLGDPAGTQKIVDGTAANTTISVANLPAGVPANVQGAVQYSLGAFRGAPGGLKLVAAGDSITAGGWGAVQLSIGSSVASGSTGTITTSSVTALPGNKIWLSGYAAAEWNGEKVIATNTGSAVTFVNATPLTAAPTAVNGTTTFINDQPYQTNRNFLALANGLLGLPFGQIISRSVSGTTTTTMLANFATDVLSLAPDYVWLLCGVNDIDGSTDANQGATVTTAFANLQAACLLALQAGSRVLLATLNPLTPSGGTGTASANTIGSAAQQAAIFRLNRLIRRYAQTTPGIILVDIHQTTGKTTNSDWIAGSSVWSSDGIHPTSYAAFKGYALQLQSVLTKAGLNRVWPLVDNATDAYETDATSLQLLPNPLFTTTTTSAITGFTGTAGAGNPVYATDCVPSRIAGTPTASIDTAARADGFGNNQRCTITATANNDIIGFTMSNSGHMNAQAALYAGRTVKFAMGFKMTNVPAGTLAGFDVLIQNPTGAIHQFVQQTNTPNFADIASGNYEFIIEGAPFVIPVVSPTYGNSPNFMQMYVGLRFAGNAAAAVFEFGRWQLIVID